MAVGFAGHGSSAFHVGIYAGRAHVAPLADVEELGAEICGKIPIFGHRSTAPRRACADVPRHGRPVRLSGESVGPPGAYGARAHFLTIMDKSDHSEFKYLVANESDHRWGITATSVGFQRVDPDEAYPSPIHPRGYYFDVVSGRVLDEYQLIYVVDGEGTLRTESGSYRLTAGTMFLIFPGGWHTYRPSPETGWSAYWIGFRGRVIDDRVGGGFFSGKSPVFRIGLSPLAVDVYREALAVAGREDPCYQQVLCGAVSLLMGLALNRSRREKPSDGVVRDKIARAKLMMIDNLSEPLSAQQIARRLNVSYSWFRSAFKRLTGMAPAQYLIELKLYRAMELLSENRMTVKEIAYALDFNSSRYFSSFFKKRTGRSPLEYRAWIRRNVPETDGPKRV